MPAGWHELVAGALAGGPCTSVAIGSTSTGQEPGPEGFEVVRAYLPDDEDTPGRRAELRRALEGLAGSTGATELAAVTVSFRPLPPEDYATSWRKSWKPFRVGRLVVLPPWREHAPRPGEVRLTLEPGGAFGTGRHATTRTCLRVLLERVSGAERVLDAGSGSGILAVTAVLLGARSALGFDVDPVATRTADALAQANGAAGRCAFRTGGFEVLRGGDRGFDAVVANLYSDLLRSEAGELAGRLRPGGWFAFSGCALAHRDPTVEALRAAGLAIEEERRRGRWCTFVGVRPAAEGGA